MRYLVILIPFTFFYSTFLYSQSKPYWVEYETIKNQGKHYFGIGVSSKSKEAADDNAYIQFGKMIELKVQSMTEKYFEENKSGIKDKLINQA